MAATVNEADCIGCGSCVSACPMEVLELADGVAKVASPDDCIECGVCVGECPNDAITV